MAGEGLLYASTGGDYMVQVDVDQNTGAHGDIWVRRLDRNNGYRVRVFDDEVQLDELEDGNLSSLASGSFTEDDTVAVKVKLDGSSIKVWIDGTKEIDTTDSTFAAGGVSLAGDHTVFTNLKIGYDNNSDDDIDDAGDDLLVDESFSSHTTTFSHDHAGNLIDDGSYVYVYDAWNRLVKVRSADDADITIQTAEFDGLGRRMKKVVTNSGDYNKTEVYLYNGHKIIETRDGSNNVVTQFIHGTQYIDELVMMRAKDKGDLYVHQDANWNVIALTDLGGSVVERYIYTPYGEIQVHQETGYGDRDGDGDVDATDKGTPGTTCTGTVSGACRILDLDFDGDYDNDDASAFDNLPQGLARHPGKTATAVEQPFGHQGLLYEPELVQYQNRARQYDPLKRRFGQRDPENMQDGDVRVPPHVREAAHTSGAPISAIARYM